MLKRFAKSWLTNLNAIDVSLFITKCEYMESTVSVATIKEIVDMLTNPSQETYIQATAQKNQILTDQRNAYELLQMLLTQNMPDRQRSLILDLLTDFIRQHNKDLALYEIHKSLFEINPEFCQAPLVISKIANLLAFIVKLIYISDNQYILTFPMNREPMSLLECREMCECCAIFEENMSNLPREENFRIQRFFQEEPLVLYTDFAISTLDTTPSLSTRLLLSCLQFRTRNRTGANRFIGNFQFQEHLANVFIENQIFNKLKQLLFSDNQESSTNSISIASSIAQSEYIMQKPQLGAGLIDFIATILQHLEIFTDKNNVTAVGNLLTSTTIVSPPLVAQIIQFILDLLQQNFILAVFLLQSCLKLCNISNQSGNDELIKAFEPVMHQFICCGLTSFDNYPEETYCAIFEDQSFTSTTIDDLFIKSQFTIIQELIFVSDQIVEMVTEPFSIPMQYRLGFLIQIARSAINNPFFLQKIANDAPLDENNQKPNYVKLLSHSVFHVMMETAAHVKEYSEICQRENSQFTLELSIIQFIGDYLSKYNMNNCSTINSQFHCSLFNEIPYFSCDGEMIYNIFWRQWSDLIEDICSKEVSDAMEKQNYSSIFSHLIKTDIPTIILTNYINYPPRYLIYTIVARIISSTPALRNEFCDSLVENFRECCDHSKSKRLFKILFCLFSVPLEKEDWGNLFVFFYNNFANLAIESAKGPSVKTVFKFVSKIVSKCPQALPYSKRNPMSFRFYKFITNILYLIGENLLKDLPSLSDVPNLSDISQNNLNLSDAISLVEAHDMKRRHTDNVTVSFASIGGNWHFARKILTTLNALFFSPFTNFGIINLYNDKSHVEVFNMIMNSMKLQDGSPLTPLLTIPKLVEEILTFFRANFGDCPEIVLEEPFLTLALHFTHLGLISNNIESIGQSFNVLIEMLNHIPNVISLQKHVILSFGVLLNISNSLGCDFLARYNEKDPSFIPNLVDSIAGNIPDHLNEPFKQTYSKYMNESGSDKFSLNLMNFFDDVSNMRIQLSTIDGFSEFFQ